MIDLALAILLIIGGYLVGSIPSGYLVCRYVFGVDILAAGSQRSGASNVLRTVGRRPAALVFVADFLKGFVPAIVARILVGDTHLVPVLVALVAAAGHNWSVFLRFRGGRGVLASFGGVMALAPVTALIGMPIGLLTLAVARYVSLGSLTGAIGFLIGAITFYALGWGVSGFELALVSALTLIMFTQHLDNLQRLFAGTERRLDPWPGLPGGRDRGRDAGG